jgi:hypothetical protein
VPVGKSVRAGCQLENQPKQMEQRTLVQSTAGRGETACTIPPCIVSSYQDHFRHAPCYQDTAQHIIPHVCQGSYQSAAIAWLRRTSSAPCRCGRWRTRGCCPALQTLPPCRRTGLAARTWYRSWKPSGSDSLWSATTVSMSKAVLWGLEIAADARTAHIVMFRTIHDM